jgi:hypothetical protein
MRKPDAKQPFVSIGPHGCGMTKSEKVIVRLNHAGIAPQLFPGCEIQQTPWVRQLLKLCAGDSEF